MAGEELKAKRKPRLGIILRLAIYLPLLGFFGWRAWERFADEREAADELFRERVAAWLEHPPQTVVLPNGEALPMLTPEQAEAQGYVLPESVREGEPDEPEPSEPEAPEPEEPEEPEAPEPADTESEAPEPADPEPADPEPADQ